MTCVDFFQVLGWLEEKLPAEKNLPSTLVAIVAPLYSCLEDRSGDVRKKAQAVVPVMMQHVGWDAMSKQANKLKVKFDFCSFRREFKIVWLASSANLSGEGDAVEGREKKKRRYKQWGGGGGRGGRGGRGED